MESSLEDSAELPAEAPAELKEEEAQARLFAACRSGDAEEARAMLKAGATVSARDGKGWSPLVWAAFSGCANVIRVLLRSGALEDFREESGASEAAQQSAAAAGDPVVGEAGANAVESKPVRSPLHWAVYEGHREATFVLLRAGLSALDVDDRGNSSLHLAAARGDGLILRSVMGAGCVPSRRNFYGNTALDLASNEGVRSLLRKVSEQAVCPGTQRPFGPNELRFLCYATEQLYTEEASNAVVVCASAKDASAMMPVRISSDAEFSVSDAEEKLRQCLNPRDEDLGWGPGVNVPPDAADASGGGGGDGEGDGPHSQAPSPPQSEGGGRAGMAVAAIEEEESGGGGSDDDDDDDGNGNGNGGRAPRGSLRAAMAAAASGGARARGGKGRAESPASDDGDGSEPGGGGVDDDDDDDRADLAGDADADGDGLASSQGAWPPSEAELEADDLEPLVAALEAVRELHGNARLIARAELAMVRLHAWVRLKASLEALQTRRPLRRREEVADLALAIDVAAAAGVSARRLDAARRSLRCAVTEARLAGVAEVCRRVTRATHKNDGDILHLSEALAAAVELGADAKLVDTAAALQRRLRTEVALDDDIAVVRKALDAAWAAAERFAEEDPTTLPRPETPPPEAAPAPAPTPADAKGRKPAAAPPAAKGAAGPGGKKGAAPPQPEVVEEPLPPLYPSPQLVAVRELDAALETLAATVRNSAAAGADAAAVDAAAAVAADAKARRQELWDKEIARIRVFEAARIKRESKGKKGKKKKA